MDRVCTKNAFDALEIEDKRSNKEKMLFCSNEKAVVFSSMSGRQIAAFFFRLEVAEIKQCKTHLNSRPRGCGWPVVLLRRGEAVGVHYDNSVSLNIADGKGSLRC